MDNASRPPFSKAQVDKKLIRTFKMGFPKGEEKFLLVLNDNALRPPICPKRGGGIVVQAIVHWYFLK